MLESSCCSSHTAMEGKTAWGGRERPAEWLTHFVLLCLLGVHQKEQWP